MKQYQEIKQNLKRLKIYTECKLKSGNVPQFYVRDYKFRI